MVSCFGLNASLRSLFSKPFLNQQVSVIPPTQEVLLLAWKVVLSPLFRGGTLSFWTPLWIFFQKHRGCIDTNGFSKAGAMLPLSLAVQRGEQIFSFMLEDLWTFNYSGKWHFDCKFVLICLSWKYGLASLTSKCLILQIPILLNSDVLKC